MSHDPETPPLAEYEDGSEDDEESGMDWDDLEEEAKKGGCGRQWVWSVVWRMVRASLVPSLEGAVRVKGVQWSESGISSFIL